MLRKVGVGTERKTGQQQQQQLEGATVPKDVIRDLFQGKDIVSAIPVKPLAGISSTPASIPLEYLCILIKPFKNNVKVARVGREYMERALVVHKVWRLEELQEFNNVEHLPADADEGALTPEQKAQHESSFILSQMPTAEESAAAATKRSKEDELMTLAEEKELLEHLGPDVVGDFDAVYERLSSKLFTLETSNVQDLMSARVSVTDVLSAEVGSAASQLHEMDSWLHQFETPLKNMRHYIEHIEETNNRMELTTKNQRELLAKLQDLLGKLKLDAARGPLETAELSKVSTFPELVAGALLLRDIINIAVQPELARMTAVKEQLEGARKVLFEFSRRLVKYLSELFLKLETRIAKDYRPTAEGVPRMPRTGHMKDLEPFVPLVIWLKDVDPSSFQAIAKAYVQAFSRVYKKVLKDFFSEVRSAINREPKERRDRLAAILFSSGSKKVDQDWYKTVKQKVTPTAEKTFTADKAFSHAFISTMTAVHAEADWITKFLGVTSETSDGQDAASVMLKDLLGDFDSALVDLLTVANKADPFYLLSAIVDLDAYSDDPCTFAKHAITGLQQECKHMFNTFIDGQIEQINATQIAIRRCGLIGHFARFPFFVDYMEESGTEKASAFSTERMEKACSALSSVTDFAYAKISVALFTWLYAIPNTHPTKKFTYIVRLENLHHFKDQIGTKRVRSLQQFQQEASEKYQRAVDGLSLFLLDKSFGKLLSFFRQIADMTATMPAEEVQFKASHSKQTCLQITNHYGPSILEDGLHSILKNLDKNLSSECGLLQEVWQALTANLLRQYETVVQLMKRCYNGTLLVSYQDLQGIIAAVWTKHTKPRHAPKQ